MRALKGRKRLSRPFRVKPILNQGFHSLRSLHPRLLSSAFSASEKASKISTASGSKRIY
jgi:hypothetical protein